MLWLSAALAAPTTAHPRMVGGTATDAYPEVLALGTPDGPSWRVFCTATLVHPRFAITAAHCLDPLPAEAAVLTGPDATQPDAVLEIAASWPSPSWDRATFFNDVGVIELTEAAPVPYVALNDEPPTPAWIGRGLRFAGFGGEVDGGFGAGVKRIADIPIVAMDPQLLFASHPERNVCQGDSGGPAFEVTDDGLELAGVIAFTVDGCVEGSNGATRIDPQLAWITSRIPSVVLDAADLPDPGVPAAEGAEIPPVDTGWGAPAAPTGGTYGKRVGCASAGGSTIGILLALGVLLGRRRL